MECLLGCSGGPGLGLDAVGIVGVGLVWSSGGGDSPLPGGGDCCRSRATESSLGRYRVGGEGRKRTRGRRRRPATGGRVRDMGLQRGRRTAICKVSAEIWRPNVVPFGFLGCYSSPLTCPDFISVTLLYELIPADYSRMAMSVDIAEMVQLVPTKYHPQIDFVIVK